MSESRTAAEMAKARTTPHESKTRPMPEPNLCAECGLSPWDDIHISPGHARRMRTAAASKARHLNALRRKAPEYAAGLRELGYTVTAPECGCTRNPLGHTTEEHPS